MDAISTVRALLAADATVNGLVSAITPLQRDQDIPVPSLTLTRVSMVPTNSLRRSEDLDRNRVQVDVWAETYASVRQIADAVRAALTSSFEMELETDLYDADVDPQLYRISQDWIVWTS